MSPPNPPIPVPAVPAPPLPARRAGGVAWILALALVLGLMRFWRLGEWSLWVDEVYTWADLRHNLGRGEIWNPLGYQAIGGTVRLTGGEANEFSLRLLPAIAGWACIPLAWWAFRGWIGDRRAAFVALLLALSSWHLFWSQTARFYTLAMVVSLIGSGFCLRGLRDGRILLALAGTAVAGSAAAFHPTAVLIVAGLCLATWLARIRDRELPPGFWRVGKAMGVLAMLGAVVASTWLWSSLEQHHDQKPTADLLSGPVHMLLTSGYFFTPLLGTAAILGALWAWHARDAQALFAVGVCLVGLGSTLVLAMFVQMTAQYVFCLLPWVLVVAVGPLDSLLERRDRARGVVQVAAWMTLLALPAAAGSALYLTSRGGERARWRDAYQWVDQQREPGDLVLGMGAPIGEFYLAGPDANPRRARMVSYLAEWFPDGPRRWNRHDRRIWVVVRPQWLEGMQPGDRQTLETWLASDCRLVRRFDVLMEGRDLELLGYLRD